MKPRHTALLLTLCAVSLRAQQTVHHAEQVTVTAYGTPLAADQTAASTIVLDHEQMQLSPAHTFGDALRQLPGVEFYRRTGTLIANPTSEGISLRGLGSTSSSRTLVLSDHVPLNDAFGGWIHWEELPALSLSSVEVVRGGASDLYGSSAVGGVVNVLRNIPLPDAAGSLPSRYASIDVEGGSQNTENVAAIAGLHQRQWESYLAGGIIRTDGYITVAPWMRGPIDTAYNARLANGSLFLARHFGAQSSGTVFARFNLYNDTHGNGTPLATNADRIARYTLGADKDLSRAQHGMLRLYGSVNHYRQSFSSVLNTPTYRSAEMLTRLLRTPAQELGAVAQYSVSPTTHLALFGGADVHDVRATDLEIPISGGNPNGRSDVTSRQRDVGIFGEVLFNRGHWTLSAGGRVDDFHNLIDTRALTQTPSIFGTTTLEHDLPERAETVANPRAGIVYRMTSGLALTGSAFRAYRSPTLYEMFRTGQVGAITTLSNATLVSERATGWESGIQLSKRNTTTRISYFWETVNRPITALTCMTPTTCPGAPSSGYSFGIDLKMRENLGQIRSNGVTLDSTWQPSRWIMLTGGYQFANATVTKNGKDAALIGKWIPEVAHNTASASAVLTHPRLGRLSLLARTSGLVFDDDENTQLIHGYTRLDAHAERSIRSFMLYADGENLFDRTIEAGRVPQLTLGNRRTVTVGMRYGFSR